MATATILAGGTSSATSTVIEVSDTPVTVGLFSTTAALSREAVILLQMITPGEANTILSFSNHNRAVVITAPGRYQVVRKGYVGAPIGVFTEGA